MMNRSWMAALVVLAVLAGSDAAIALTVNPGDTPGAIEAVAVRWRSFGNTAAEEIYLGIPDLDVIRRAAVTLGSDWAEATQSWRFDRCSSVIPKRSIRTSALACLGVAPPTRDALERFFRCCFAAFRVLAVGAMTYLSHGSCVRWTVKRRNQNVTL